MNTWQDGLLLVNEILATELWNLLLYTCDLLCYLKTVHILDCMKCRHYLYTCL